MGVTSTTKIEIAIASKKYQISRSFAFGVSAHGRVGVGLVVIVLIYLCS